jgi:hypothetical protein
MLLILRRFLVNCKKNYKVEEEKTGSYKPINIKEVFAAKNPRLARVMPGFVYRFIHSVMEIEFINNLLERHGHLWVRNLSTKLLKSLM